MVLLWVANASRNRRTAFRVTLNGRLWWVLAAPGGVSCCYGTGTSCGQDRE